MVSRRKAFISAWAEAGIRYKIGRLLRPVIRTVRGRNAVWSACDLYGIHASHASLIRLLVRIDNYGLSLFIRKLVAQHNHLPVLLAAAIGIPGDGPEVRLWVSFRQLAASFLRRSPACRALAVGRPPKTVSGTRKYPLGSALPGMRRSSRLANISQECAGAGGSVAADPDAEAPADRTSVDWVRFTILGSGDLYSGGLKAAAALFFAVSTDRRDLGSTLSLTSRSRDSTIIAVEAGMFVPVWFIVVAIGLLIAVALHSCDEDRGRKRARLSQWSL
jgi:hypothetical protein